MTTRNWAFKTAADVQRLAQRSYDERMQLVRTELWARSETGYSATDIACIGTNAFNKHITRDDFVRLLNTYWTGGAKIALALAAYDYAGSDSAKL